MPGPSAMVMFDVLADPTRRKVVELLAQGPRRAGQLAAEAGTSPQAMSNHLRVLLDAGVIADERLPEAWLDQLQAEWRVQLESFKHHVEGKAR